MIARADDVRVEQAGDKPQTGRVTRDGTYPQRRLGFERGPAVGNARAEPTQEQRLRGKQFDMIKSPLAAAQHARTEP